MRRIPLHWQIIGGIVLGAGWGMLATATGWEAFTTDWIKPFGTIFINLLKLVAVPLILISLINGISNLRDIAKLSRIGSKTVIAYLITTLIAVTVGLLLVNVLEPGNSFTPEQQAEFRQEYASESAEKAMTAKGVKEDSPLSFLVDIVPENLVAAASDNANMLQIIFFAIFFGIAMVLVPEEKTKPIKQLVEGANDVILKLIELIMRFAPFGVFALIGAQIADFGEDVIQLLGALGMYTLTVVLGLLFLMLILYPFIVTVFSRMSYRRFLRGIGPAQIVAFSTSSSAATLPVTMDRCEKKLGVSEEVSSFVLPLGATINMDGTSLYQAVGVVFIAQAFGFDLTLAQQLTIVLTATLASIGAAAVPSAGIIMMVVVLESVGLDPEGIGLIIAMDRPLDMLRTSVNVTGDATVASLVAYSENELATAKENIL